MARAVNRRNNMVDGMTPHSQAGRQGRESAMPGQTVTAWPGECGMRRGCLTPLLLLAVLSGLPQHSLADPFRCPRSGGTFTFGQEANFNTLDQMASATISTRNIAMNIYESLMTRDENNRPILELAEAMTEAPDRMSYSFKLRQG